MSGNRETATAELQRPGLDRRSFLGGVGSAAAVGAASAAGVATLSPRVAEAASTDPSYPDVPDEPVLNVANIQANILPGLGKERQQLLFLRITQPAAFRKWLAGVIPSVTTAAQSLGRAAPSTRPALVNIAFSAAGLAKLTPDCARFTDEAFKQGLAARSAKLGDPLDPQAEGHPRNWKIGGPGNEADAVVIVAADDQAALDFESEALRESLMSATAGATVMFVQAGASLNGDLAGHEHFGFRDGISQPGVRGRLSPKTNDVLTPRQNPLDRGQGRLGQDLLWPGEFVFGYPGQDPKAADIAVKGPVAKAGPAWADDGSFLVFRRLRQDVGLFHDFLRKAAGQMGLPPAALGAKLVGRWKSGAPVIRTPNADNPGMAASDGAVNHFEFGEASDPITARVGSADLLDKFPPSPGDPAGVRIPICSHIRKTYPRDDESASDPTLGEVVTQTRRIMRRGIPFGPQSTSTPEKPVFDKVDRGLLFLAYQTSIVEQFEAISVRANDPNFKDPGSGHDPIIGQNNASPNRERFFRVPMPPTPGAPPPRMPPAFTLKTTSDFVIPTGGGYFFAPSLAALRQFTTAAPAPAPSPGPGPGPGPAPSPSPAQLPKPPPPPPGR
jgi:Dyp-type peroxidase family